MKRFLLLLLISCAFASCRKNENPVQPPQAVTRLDIATKLKQWSTAQSQPFVIYAMSDTSYGYYDEGVAVVKNDSVRYNGDNRWSIGDSLVIDTASAAMLGKELTDTELKTLYESITPSRTEEQMSGIARQLGLKFRMMKYDSLTYNLNRKLWEWAKHQYPPKVVWSGSYYFVSEGPNAGGYSGVTFYYDHTQRLQYFTRHIDPSSLAAIVDRIDISLSYAQLRDILLPVAPIQIHDTVWGSE